MSREKGEFLEVHCNLWFRTLGELSSRTASRDWQLVKTIFCKLGQRSSVYSSAGGDNEQQRERRVLRLSVRVLLSTGKSQMVLKTEPQRCVSGFPDLFLFWYVL